MQGQNGIADTPLWMQFADWILPLMLLSSEDAHGRTAVEVTSNTAASSPHLEAPAPPAVA
jgi:hypothetical protein